MTNKSIFPENTPELPLHISQQATEWYVRLQADDVTEQDFYAFQTWLNADKQHQQAWQCLEQFGLSLNDIQHPLLHPALTAIQQQDQTHYHTLKSMLWFTLFASSLFGLYKAQPQKLWQQWQADYRTNIGEQKKILLADGSQIVLNTNSAINIHYSDTQRQIELIKGEIQIKVHPEQQHRPFTVENRDGVMQDIGTVFNIRQNDQNTMLSVTEGEVKLTPQHTQKNVHISANQQVLFNQQSIKSIEILDSKYSTWTKGTLSVYKMPLTEFITELDRYHHSQLYYDRNIADLEVSGVFPIQDQDKVLQALQETLPIKVESKFYYWKKISLKDN